MYPRKGVNDTCDLDPIWDRKVECAPGPEINAMATAAWLKLREGLLERSPFYHIKFTEAGVELADVATVEDLKILPFTTKDELRRSQEEQPPFGKHLGVEPESVKLVFQTSGTTGRPSLVALTKSDIETWVKIGARSFFASGVHPHSSVLTTFGAGPFVAGATHSVLDRIGARRVPVGPGDTSRVIAAFQGRLVDTFLGTPSFALFLVNRFHQEGVDPKGFGLKHIITGGEPGGGLPNVRDQIEAAFGAYVTESMGIGDVATMIYGECPQQGGMHFTACDCVWVELIDHQSGEPLAIEPGVVGEPVYTTLVREAMPVVRFRSGDLIQIEGTSCGCGRSGFRMRCVGRTDDMFIVRGVNVYPSALQDVIGAFRPQATGRMRVVLDGASVNVTPPVNVEVECPAGVTPGPDLAGSIEDAIRARLLFKATVRFVSEEEFGDAGYKTRSVVRR